MAHIFISYSRKDETFARQLAEALSRAGADVWLDVDDIPAGMNWSSAIQQGLRDCELMIVIISPESMASRNVEEEWQYYRDKNKPIVPVLLRQADVHYQLSRLQYIDFEKQPFEWAYKQLQGEVRRNGIPLAAKSATTGSSGAVPTLPPNPVSTLRQRANGLLGAGALVALLAVGALTLNALNGGSAPTPTPPSVALATTASPTFDVKEATLQTPSPTLAAPELQAALATARSFSGSNADWQTLYPDGFQHTFEDGVTMVLVPVGSFTIGDNPQSPDERAGSVITFSEPFWIDMTEVTQADFERLGGSKANPNGFDGDQRPVEQITWFEARDFCALRSARLLTEAEWEYAARGPAGWDYPWGDTWNDNNAVWNRSSLQGTANVAGILAGRSWIGAFDLGGNVWEWVSSLYLPYDSQEDREGDPGTRTAALRVLRGGSWGDDYFRGLRAGFRSWNDPFDRYNYGGFRCARSS